jgi:serine/threonine protein kinase
MVRPLGSGGQSEVYLVRNPMRVRERQLCLETMRTALENSRDEQGPRMSAVAGEFAQLSYDYARPDNDDELGALKVFQITGGVGEHQRELRRFHNEVTALKEIPSGVLKFIAANIEELWIITEYIPGGSLRHRLKDYAGNALLSLKAFRTVVATVKVLHDRGWVHRDIKPANVFVRKIDELVLGDMGIVYVPEAAERGTELNERVGPRDYMAPWLDIGERVEEVGPASDVYMLGKLLWCMVSGRPKLPREHHLRPSHDVTKLFPGSSEMQYINAILDRCVVADEHLCLQSAGDLLVLVDQTIKKLQMGDDRILPDGSLNLTCLMCGKAKYKQRGSLFSVPQLGLDGGIITSSAILRPFTCGECGHYLFFAPGYPEEAEQRWRRS